MCQICLIKYVRCAVAFGQRCFDVWHGLGPNLLLKQNKLLFQDTHMLILKAATVEVLLFHVYMGYQSSWN